MQKGKELLTCEGFKSEGMRRVDVTYVMCRVGEGKLETADY